MQKFKSSGSAIDLAPAWIEKNKQKLRGQPVGLYGRISGVASLDGTSLESQSAVNRRFALACGANIIAEHTEVITGISITARVKFNELLVMAERGEIKYIIVDVRDRLGRGEAIAVLEFLARQSGAEIIYATQPADLETYEGVALEATETLVSRIERLNIQRRTNRGRREWASQGRVFSGRFFPYGYRIRIQRDGQGRLIDRTLIIFDPEAHIVRLIFQWCVYEGMTTYAIAARLEYEKIPVPAGHLSNRTHTQSQ
jgi:site-specific DNA recombinase